MIVITMSNVPLTHSHTRFYEKYELKEALVDFIEAMEVEGVNEGKYQIEIDCDHAPTDDELKMAQVKQE